MKFRYKARNQQGVLQEGQVEAATINSAMITLQRHNLVVISIEPIKESSLSLSLYRVWEGVKPKEFVIFSRQLAVLVEAKVPLTMALKGIINQSDNPYFAKVLAAILADVDEGKTLSESMKKHPDVFSELYANMVESGELSGNLQKVLEDLADNTEKNYALTQRIKGVLYYPSFIIIAFVTVAFLMLSFVIPKLLSMVEETAIKLPWTTKLLIAVGDFMHSYWWVVLLAMMAAIAGGVYYIKTEDGKKEKDILILKVPLLGKVVKYIYLARFAENFSTLVKSGIPIVNALQISARVVGNVVYEQIILDVAERVKVGETISENMAKYEEFPQVMVQMMKIGEETGKIDSTLTSMAKFYTREADQLVSNLSSIIEPILIVVLGIGVGILVFSIIIPIYNVAQSIK